MSSGPRKFSEKIALLNQKQAEQNAAFISIISEVKSIRPTQPQQNIKIQQNSFLNSSNNYIGGNNSQNFQSINSNKDMLNDIITEAGHPFLQTGFSNKDNLHNSTNQPILNNNDNMNFSCDYELTQQQNSNIKPLILGHKNFSIQQKPNQTEHHASNSPFLQLPSQSDSFRRAHSDSSLHQTSGNISNTNYNQSNNSAFHNTVKFGQNDVLNNNCFNMSEQPNSLLNNSQTQMSNFNVPNYQDNTHSLPLNYGNYQNHNMQNHIDFSAKSSNSLMPHSPVSPTQNTFASLPDLTTFNYPHNQNELSVQDNSVMASSHQHNLIGPLKPTHHSTSPTRITARYSPTHSNRRLSPQRSDKYPSPVQNLNLRNNYGIQNNNMVPNNMYRNNNPSESLPPSPQSQQSCFNSPQGSPGPHSISPQDINPFTCNNYESMQKKFDLFNLESPHPPYNAYNNNTQKVLPVSKGIINGSNACISQNSLQNNTNTADDSNSDNNHQSGNNLSPQCPNLMENINFNKQLIKGNPQMLQQNNSNNNNNNNNHNNNNNSNNRANELIENTDIRANFNQLSKSCDNPNLSINSTQIYCSSNMNNMNNMNNTLHKNSIPDIILTSFSDSVEDKTDFVNVLQDNLYSHCNSKVDDSLDFEQLQIFGESVESQDGLTLDSINHQILQYPESDP